MPALQLITKAGRCELLSIHLGYRSAAALRRYSESRNYITVEPADTDGGLQSTTVTGERAGYDAVVLQAVEAG